MALGDPFVWGEGGSALTPEQLKERRKVAAALLHKRVGDASPIGHWTQGLARVADGVLAGLEARDLDAKERENTAYDADFRKRLFGAGSSGGSSESSGGGSSSGSSPAAPSFPTSIGNVADPEGPTGDEFRSRKTAGPNET